MARAAKSDRMSAQRMVDKDPAITSDATATAAIDLFAGPPAPAQLAQAKPLSAPAASLPRRPPSAGAIGAKLAKSGYGLCLRTADGEDSITPFRSLEDLLSAVKPILRTAARSPEPVWISISPIDLAEIDSDAA